jgi:phosphate starvation-inducible PhoH-like protein
MIDSIMQDVIAITYRGRQISPKHWGKSLVEAIRKNTVTFAVGPAGTGKRILPWPWRLSLLKTRK